MTDTSAAIDSHRPWIKDQRDDPSQMNWLQTLFNPYGLTGKLHFTRAWTLMFMGRVLLFIVPVSSVLIMGLAGADLTAAWQPMEAVVLPIPALLVPFFFFMILTEFTSWVAHVRRLADANRSTLLAMIVLIPLFLGLVGFAGGLVAGAGQYRADQAQAPAASVQTEAASPEGVQPVPQNAAQPDTGPQGRKGPPMTERQMALNTGMGIAGVLWALASFGVMLWTLLFVARMPNGGVGAFRTGSDLSQEAQKSRPYETAP